MSEPDIMVETYGTCKYQDSTETVECFNKIRVIENTTDTSNWL